MLIGSSGSFDVCFSPEECVHRLNVARSASAYVGYVDERGFQFSRYGRTAVRVRGSFSAKSIGCHVDYRIELIPGMLWALGGAYAIGIPVLIGLILFGYVPASALAWAVVITAGGLGLNLWFCERQAAWLRDYVATSLEAK